MFFRERDVIARMSTDFISFINYLKIPFTVFFLAVFSKQLIDLLRNCHFEGALATEKSLLSRKNNDFTVLRMKMYKDFSFHSK